MTASSPFKRFGSDSAPASANFDFWNSSPAVSPGSSYVPRGRHNSTGQTALGPTDNAPDYFAAQHQLRPEKRRKLEELQEEGCVEPHRGQGSSGETGGEGSAESGVRAINVIEEIDPEPAFQVIVLGSGGGPSESNVSGYLLRSTATSWAPGSVVAVDAGTHLAGIVDIMETQPPPSRTRHSLATTSDIPNTTPFSGCRLPFTSPAANALHVTQELVSTFLITHTHLDHISGLVINTAAFIYGQPKTIAALPPAVEAIKRHIFNDMIWPNLSDEDSGAGLLKYQRLPPGEPHYTPVAQGLSVQAHPVSHGHCMKQHTHFGRLSNAGLDIPAPRTRWCVLDSAVFFVRDDATGRECMMWGDVEPDSISLDPRNREVWMLAARKFAEGRLRTVFIECSYNGQQKDEALYGHLNPDHLMRELRTFAEGVGAAKGGKREAGEGVEEVKGLLKGLVVVVTHVKDVMAEGRDSVLEVERELRELEEKRGLGVRFVMAKRGMGLYF